MNSSKKNLPEDIRHQPGKSSTLPAVANNSSRDLITEEHARTLQYFMQSAQTYESYIKRRSRTRIRKKVLQFLTFVSLATALAIYYFGYIATDRYVSTFQFTIESSRQTTSGFLDGILGSTGTSSDKETNLLFEYMRSPAILKKLDEWLDLRGHYSQLWIDYFSRLNSRASDEEFVEYYRDVIDIDTTTTPNVVTVEVQAFDPAYAQTLADVVVILSEELINKVNEKALEDAVSFAKQDLNKAEQRLSKAQERLTSYQDAEVLLDPQQSAATVVGIVEMLEAQLAQTRSQLTELLSFMREDAVQVVAVKAKINALEQQIEIERSKLAGQDARSAAKVLSHKLSDFERIRAEVEFAKQAYQASLVTLESAKAEALKKFSYVVAFVPPILPDSSTKPDRVFSILSTALGSAVMFMLLSFIWATIRDHIDS